MLIIFVCCISVSANSTQLEAIVGSSCINYPFIKELINYLYIYDDTSSQPKDLSNTIGKALDERKGGAKGITPERFSSVHNEARLQVFKKYNTAIPSSAAVERVFSISSDILRPKRASLTSGNFEKLVLLREIERFFGTSIFFVSNLQTFFTVPLRTY